MDEELVMFGLGGMYCSTDNIASAIWQRINNRFRLPIFLH
jgi:hypothetical protein